MYMMIHVGQITILISKIYESAWRHLLVGEPEWIWMFLQFLVPVCGRATPSVLHMCNPVQSEWLTSLFSLVAL